MSDAGGFGGQTDPAQVQATEVKLKGSRKEGDEGGGVGGFGAASSPDRRQLTVQLPFYGEACRSSAQRAARWLTGAAAPRLLRGSAWGAAFSAMSCAFGWGPQQWRLEGRVPGAQAEELCWM